MAEEAQDPKNIQANNNSVAVGNVTVGGSIAGSLIIGNSGLSAEQVSALITQISTTFQPKPFDGRSPYKGLDSFEEQDAELFFGREKLVDNLISQVKDSRTLFVTGPSGSGKSSLVRAGLIHSLRQGAIQDLCSERWQYATMRPGRDPFEAMAAAFSRLKSPELGDYFLQNACQAEALQKCAESMLSERRDERLVLFIDQFEEVFTQLSKEKGETFIELLAHAADVEEGRIVLLFAMRSDFVPNCATYPRLNALLNRQFVQIGAMGTDELVSAIAQPALRVGLRIDPDLIAQIINDMQGEPGALPLMQFALKDLFVSRQSQGGVMALTLHDYLQRGGIHKALERHADESFNGLDGHERELARSIFTGLIEIGRGTQDTRRTAIFDELVPANAKSEEVEAIVRKLADARLITTDATGGRDTVTISHEKLIEAWPWLRKLVNENRDVIALQNEIVSDAKEWEEHNRDDSYLYSGAKLGLARERLAARKIVLSGLASEYIEQGIAAREAERKARETQRRRIMMSLISGIAVAMILAGIAFYQMLKAEKQATIAHARQLAAQSVALREKDFSLSLLLGLEAYTEDPSIQTRGTLLDNVQTNPSLLKYLAQHRDQVFSVAFSPDGTLLASGSRDTDILLWDVETGQRLGQLSGHKKPVNSVAFSPDGSILASGGQDQSILLWDVHGYQALASLTGHEGTVYSIAFNRDGSLLASGSADGTVRVWDVASRQLSEPPLERHTGPVISVAFSRDGSLIASGSEDGTITLWNVETHQPLDPPLTGQADAIVAVAFSPDGKTLASGGSENDIFLWDVETHQHMGQLTGHEDYVTSLAFSPDGTRLVSASLDRTLILWDVERRQPIGRPLTGHASWVRTVAFSQDGQKIASGGLDKRVILWNAEEIPLLSQDVSRHENDVDVYSVAISRDGRVVASSDGEGRIVLWDRRTNDSIDVPGSGDHGKGISLSFSPDGKALAAGQEDGSIFLWDIPNHRPRDPQLDGQHARSVNSVAFSPDGRMLASGSDDHSIFLWDVESGQLIGQLSGHQKPVRSVAFSPDGKLMASGSEDTTILLWDVEKRQILAPPLDTHQGTVRSLAFSPDGQTLASGSEDQTVILWNLEGPRRRQATFASQSAAIYSVAFSPDGNTLASGGYRSSIQLWNVENKEEPVPLGEPLLNRTLTITSLAVSPTDPSLIAGGINGSLLLWNLDLQHWIDKTCERAGRNLSHDEWKKYQPGKNYRLTCPKWPPAEVITPTPEP